MNGGFQVLFEKYGFNNNKIMRIFITAFNFRLALILIR